MIAGHGVVAGPVRTGSREGSQLVAHKVGYGVQHNSDTISKRPLNPPVPYGIFIGLEDLRFVAIGSIVLPVKCCIGEV